MRFRNPLLRALAAATTLALVSLSAQAGSFSVSPLRVDFSSRAQTGALTIRNQQDEDVVVEAQVMLWEQIDGADRLTETRDVLVSPVVFSLKPNGSQLVRVALQRQIDPRRELSYRLILNEVPPQAAPNFTGLNVALRISLPMFVDAPAAAPATLEWSAERGAGDTLAVSARNVGDVHARVLNFSIAPTPTLDGVTQSVATYILPNQTRTWPIAIHQQDGASGSDWRQLRLKGTTEAGDFELEISPTVR